MQFAGINALMQEAATTPAYGEIHAQISQVQTKTTKTNKPYLEITLADAETSFTLKIWDNAPWYSACAALKPLDGIAARALWTKGAYGMEAADLDIRPLTPEEEQNLFTGNPELRQQQETCYRGILSLSESMQDPRLRLLCLTFLRQFEKPFRRAAAARGYHHARRGGLVEHIYGMMHCADAIASAYPHLNRDLLLAGCLFHDCGKLWENNYGEHDFVMPYNELGELLGHITIGIELINTLYRQLVAQNETEWNTLVPGNDQVRLHLLHLIAAHHGELAFGSPVPPKTPEAIALHYIDNLDAKLEMFRNAYTTSEQLAPRIQQKKAPLPGNVVHPLPKIDLPEK